MARYKGRPVIDPGHNRKVGRKSETGNLEPFYVMRCGGCGWTCWNTRDDPIPCQRCDGIMRLDRR